MYSSFLRKRVLKAYKELNSLRKVAKLFNISKSIISLWNRCITSNKQPTNYRRKTTPLIETTIVNEVKQNKFYTLSELVHLIKTKYKVLLSRETIRKILKCNNYCNKRCHHKVKIKDEQIKIKQFKDYINKQTRKVVCLDETYFRYHMKPYKGWVLKGEECVYNTDKVYSTKVCNMLMMISEKGNRYLLNKEKMNSDTLLKFIEEHKSLLVNNLLVMDNVAFHKEKRVVKYLKEINCDVLYIVPYHCELNPIEEVFSLVKNYVRKCLPQTYEDYVNSIDKSINLITKEKLKKYYEHSFT